MNQPYKQMLARRAMLQSALGFSALAVNGIMAAEQNASPDGRPHFAPKAKKVIWLFMRGGVSHMESFDPKPALNKYAGKSIGDTPYASVLDPAKIRKLRGLCDAPMFMILCELSSRSAWSQSRPCLHLETLFQL